MRIVLDAMGSDNYPEPEVIAAVEAAKRFGDEIFLVGQQEKLIPLLEKHNPSKAPVTLIHAPEVFEMTDKISGSALRKAENSMGVGMNLLKDGKADAFVTAGNTGGAMAIGLARLGRIKGVKRPFYWWNRTPILRCKQPKGDMYWRPAVSLWKTMPRIC